jgi:hypothetical protein
MCNVETSASSAESCDVGWIASKIRDMPLNQFEDIRLIYQAEVGKIARHTGTFEVVDLYSVARSEDTRKPKKPRR